MISVIVPAYNRAGLTEVCLTEIRATTPDAEIVLVDNGSTDDTHDLYPLANQVVPLGVNIGFGAGCNR